ncbi:S8 family serine peptidase [Arthrobacter rhizosphaerae]|uniref:S8 family serine peptidase n=1 Tax=Arthrobacter rhizosphaerae TaxID=2855490 RepID=UPI001FF6203A|nr:S8 family serine peptidase [Arthrobacter rhizosphaerae]
MPGDSGRYLVQFVPGADVAAESAALRSQGVGVGRTFSAATRGAVITATPGQAAALKRSARVAAVEIDAPVSITETQQPAPWGLDRTDQRTLPLSGGYTYSSVGAGVNAYVVDSGVLASHVEFGGRVTTGWSAISDGLGSSDCNGHGTHVAGTVAGKNYGVAKAATIVPVRVLDCLGSGYNSDVIAGLDWVAAHHAPGTPAVVNMSLGGSVSSMVDSAVQGVINDGVTAVVAAGNSSVDACNSSPARAPQALTVAATDSSDRQASFSNFGACVDLYAPGVGILSAGFGSTTASVTMNGTSMATPHVAGVAAVLLSRTPSSTPADVAAKVLATATPGVVAAAGAGTPNRLLFSDPAPAPAPAPAPVVAPTVTAYGPAKNAMAVPVGSNATATFSTGVQGVSGSTFVLKTATGATVPATVTYSAATRTATLDPTASLAADQKYTATLIGGTTGIRDTAGTPLATTSWTFTTGPAPVVISRTPAPGATFVRRANNITVTFSEAIQGAGTSTITVKNTATGALVPASVSRYGTTNQWILNPSASLAAKTNYTVTVTGGAAAIRDLAGNPLSTVSWTFTTGAF